MSFRGHLSIFATLFVTACSGAASTELFDLTGQDDDATEPVSGSANDPSQGDDAATGGPMSGSGSSSGGSSSSGGPNDDEGDDDDGKGTDDDANAPAPPPPGCVAETEPNDDNDDANAFTSCFTGALARTDLDYAKIVAPPDAKKIEIKHKEDGGRVWYRVYVDGFALPAFDEDMPGYIPVVAGATYVIQMSPAKGGSANRTYQLNVTFE